MLGLPFQLDLQPSFYTGFARSADESEYPGLWNRLIGLWVPAMGPTGVILRDLSPSRLNGDFRNMEPDTDWIISDNPRLPGYALKVDGVDEDVMVLDPQNIYNLAGIGGSVMTVTVWVKRTAVDGGVHTMAGEGATVAGWHVFIADDDQITFFTGNVKDYNFAQTITDITDWHHIAYVYDESFDVSMFFEGIFSEIITHTGPALTTTNDLVIGSRGTNWAKLQIGLISIHDRKLLPAEIKLLHDIPLAPLVLRPRLFVKAQVVGGDVRRHVIPAYMRAA